MSGGGGARVSGPPLPRPPPPGHLQLVTLHTTQGPAQHLDRGDQGSAAAAADNGGTTQEQRTLAHWPGSLSP